MVPFSQWSEIMNDNYKNESIIYKEFVSPLYDCDDDGDDDLKTFEYINHFLQIYANYITHVIRFNHRCFFCNFYNAIYLRFILIFCLCS